MIRFETIHLDKYFNKHTKNSIHVINDTSLKFEDKGFVAILGESGSGKTTLLNVLSGIDKANSGKILYDGIEFKASSRESENIRNNKFGYVFQNYYMIQDITVYENLYLALAPYHLQADEVNERIDYVLSSVGMSKYKKRMMNQLSGGQAQRIAIARALIKSPEVIFADEPTGNLDETTTLKIMMILKKISEKCLVIVATHERRIAEFFADRIIHISDGVVQSDIINEYNGNYEAVDDNNLYLQEYEAKLVSDEEDEIKIYKARKENLKFSLIVDHDRYYILADNPKKFEIITPESNIQAIDSKRPEIDKEQIDKFEYDLVSPSKTNDGLISFKYTLSKVFNSIRSKSFYIMIVALILISGITTWGVGDFETIYHDNVKSVLKDDSRSAKIEIVDTTTITNVTTKASYYSSVARNIDNDVEGTMVFPTASFFAYFLYEGAYQIEQIAGVETTAFNNFTYVPLDLFNPNELSYGRMPKAHNEVIVDEWVLDNFMAEPNIVSQAITKYESFLNKKFYVRSSNTTFTIVGISRSKNIAVYALASDLINAYKNISISTFNKLKEDFPGEYDDIELRDNLVICNQSVVNAKGVIPQSVSIYGYSFGTYQEKTFPSSYPIRYVMTETAFRNLLYRIIQGDEAMNVYSTNKEALKNYVDDFNKNENDPTRTNPTHKVIELIYKDNYTTVYNNYMHARRQKITMRLAITLSIITMCSITLFVTMKAHANENMQSIMVYRLLGLKKRIVIRMYAVEIFITSFVIMIPTSLIVAGVLKFIEFMPGSSFVFGLTLPVYLLTILALTILNILIGILPISLIMKKTPAELVSSYDI